MTKRLATFVLLAAAAAAQFKIPDALDQLVNDYARVLSDASETRLRGVLRPLSDDGTPIVVLTVRRLRDHRASKDDVASFAKAVYDSWGIGRAGENRGALFLLAPEDRKWFVELGRGWSAYNTSALVKAVGDAVAPAFRREDFASGIEAAIDVLKRRVIDAAAAGGAAPRTPKADEPVNPVDKLIELERGYDVEYDPRFDVEPADDVVLPGDVPPPAPTPSDPPYVRKEWRERQSRPHHPGFSFGCGSWICWAFGIFLLISLFRGGRRAARFGGGLPYRRYGGGFSWGSAVGGFLLGNLLSGGRRSGGGGWGGGSSGGGWSGGIGGGGGSFGGGRSGGGFGGSW